MKLSTSSLSKPKALHIDSLKGGLNFTENSHNGLTGFNICQNVWQKNGNIETRPAFVGDMNGIIDYNRYRDEGVLFSFETLEKEILVDGDIKKIVKEEMILNQSVYFVLLHFLNSDFTLWKTTELAFFRVTDDVFYIPKKILLFEGKPKNGCGLYVIASLVNTENFNDEPEVRFFELDSEYSQWESCGKAYTPTVFINGRGNKYEISKATGQAFTGTPQKLEQLNILNGAFYAYFSTDGRSSSFRLPFSGLDNKTVFCRLYYSVNDYVDWIAYDEQTTATADLYGSTVTMTVNREKGIISFSVPAGEYEVPLITDRNENNLRIMASKTRKSCFNILNECSEVLETQGEILLSSGSELYVADRRKPLYFPTESAINVGTDSCDITALKSVGGNVACFKENSVHKIGINRGTTINPISLLADSDAIFYEADTLSVTTVSTRIGCPNESAVTSDENNFYFRGSDGGFYSLSSSYKLKCISDKIAPFIKRNFLPDKCTMAWKLDNYIVFSSGSKLLLTDISQNYDWYYWEIPEEASFSGALSSGGTTRLLMKYNEIGYFVDLTEGDDYVFTGTYRDITEHRIPIKTVIKTNKNSLGCNHSQKSISEIDLILKGEKISVNINGNPLTFIHSARNGFDPAVVKLFPALVGVNSVDLTLESNKAISVGSMDIKYNNLEL